MLLAVNMGRPQSPKSLLSRRRSSRRLLLVNLPCIVAFTRNPSWLRVLRKVDTFSNPGNTERFRVFYEILPPIIGGFASLMTRRSNRISRHRKRCNRTKELRRETSGPRRGDRVGMRVVVGSSE